MNKRTLEAVLETIMSQPTAPFHEYHVRAAIQAALKGVAGVKCTVDAHGNLIARYKKGRGKARWALGAHMDHPGWVRTRGGGREFLGGVPEAVRMANVDRVAWFGEFGMWDLPAYERWNGSVISRACDDLAGCAIQVAVLQEIARRELPGDFYALFTRAEEVGFLGITRMIELGSFPENVTFLSLETSAPVEGAKPGAGPVLRVGDRLSVFDHRATAAIESIAKAHHLPFQRLLLDRGACEASAVQAHGIPAAALSILLENYHNIGPGNSIAAEKIEVEDAFHLARLLVAILTTAEPPDAYASLRERVGDLARRHQPHEQFAEKCWPPTRKSPASDQLQS
jgi:putative aminopeptidase FrvX